MKIESIIFDLDNTIYPESEYFSKIIDQFCDVKKIDRNHFNFLFENFDEIRFTRSNIFKFILEKTNLYNTENQEYLFELYTSIKTEILPYDGIADWFKCCHQNNIKIGILTNGIVEAQKNKWESLVLKKNDVFFIPSRELGKDKPNPETFLQFFTLTQFDITSTLFVGDRFLNDIEFGISNGAQGILIGEKHSEIPSFATSNLAFSYFQREFIDK